MSNQDYVRSLQNHYEEYMGIKEINIIGVMILIIKRILNSLFWSSCQIKNITCGCIAQLECL